MIDRRAFLRSTAGAATLGGVAMMATPSAAVPLHAVEGDPILAFLNSWESAISGFLAAPREEKDAHWTTFVAPCEDRARRGDIPQAQTMEGAIAAIRKALSYDDMEDQDANLIRSALAFLDGLDAKPAADDPLLVVINEFRAREAADALMGADELDALWDVNDGFGPAFKRLRDDPPAAATMPGVEAALQLMADEDAKGNDWLRSGFLEQAVFPFFKGRPS